MRILIAPDSFKESLSAWQATQAIYKGFQTVFPQAQYDLKPMADGGEGTSHVLTQALSGQWKTLIVQDPLGRKVQAGYGLLPNKTAVMEMAQASGLHLLSLHERNPLQTSTYGVGQMIVHALEHGVTHIILGIGGSATNDGGMGMAQALGYRFFDRHNQPLPLGAKALMHLHHIDASHKHPQLDHCKFTVACDVTNPLCGEQGASAVFGPQKGATPEMVVQLDLALAHYAQVLATHGYRALPNQAGSGAAGGLGFGLMAFTHAVLKKGVDLVIDVMGIHDVLKDVDLVITGEGRMDDQTQFGKVPAGILRAVQQSNRAIAVIAIAGSVNHVEDLNQLGFTAVFPSLWQCGEFEAIKNQAAKNVEQTAHQVALLLKQAGYRR